MESRDFNVLDIPGSDHRVIFARLRLLRGVHADRSGDFDRALVVKPVAVVRHEGR